ncbi:hypothetical protein B0H10DRAFT_1953140 [Mycena sp. CBHHK59/15]|nr:hypothetical protein B0H10DRAFT_1953140 [Mycena sp. CBHHK59/15]
MVCPPEGSPPPFGASTPSVHNAAENGLYPNARWAVVIDYYPNARWAAGISLRDGSNNTVVAKVKAHWAADEFGVFGACFVAVSLQDESNIGVIAKDQPDAALVDHGPSQPLVGGGPRVNGKFAVEAVVPHVVNNHGINNFLEGSFTFECQCPLDDVKRLLGKKHFVEAGCVLSLLREFKGSLDNLCARGVTRKEQFNSNDPIEELDGPVLGEDCEHLVAAVGF